MKKANHKLSRWIGGLVLLLLVLPATSRAFPFRELAKGGAVPELMLRDLEGHEVSSAGIGKPYVAVFWGADLPDKLARAADILEAIEGAAPFFSTRQIAVFSVNSQGDDPETIREVMRRSGSTAPVYVDEGQQAYRDLGIFVMPAVLLVDKDGRAAAGFGFSHDLLDRLRGAVEIMGGEKEPAEVEAELHPEMEEKSQAEKTANRHMNFGMVMLAQGFPDTAIREFQAALELNPELAAARVELGCLYLEKDELDRAAAEIDAGLRVMPDSLRGLLCQATLAMKKGLLDQALAQAEAIKAAHPEVDGAYYLLGKVYEARRQMSLAMAEYKQAYLLLARRLAVQAEDKGEPGGAAGG